MKYILFIYLLSLYLYRSSSDPSLQRLQTALGLYSNDLCGLVLLKNKDDVGSLDDLSKGL